MGSEFRVYKVENSGASGLGFTIRSLGSGASGLASLFMMHHSASCLL